MHELVRLLSRFGPAGVFVIAALDSAGIPLPMGVDALIIAIAIASPRQAYLAVLLAVAGSAAGNAFLYYLARKGGEAYLNRHTESPRARKFRGWFQRYGLITVFIPTVVPIVPLPLKIFVLTAGGTQVSLVWFLLTIVSGRALRFLGLAYLGRKLGENSLGWLHAHALELTLIAVGLFLLLFGLVKWADHRRRRAPAPEVAGEE